MSDDDPIDIDIGPPKVCVTCISFLHAEGQKAVKAHLRANRGKRGFGDAIDMMRPSDRRRLGLCAQKPTMVCMPAGTCEKWSPHMTLTEAQQLRVGDLVLVMSSATQPTPATVREIRLAGKATRIDVRYQNGRDGSVPLQRVRARPA